MNKAARAIIFSEEQVLVMHRNKYGSEYYTLVGGRVNEDESIEDALIREVREETGLTVVDFRLVFIEKHQPPYNEQYVYLCAVESHDGATLQTGSEEEVLNRYQLNLHKLAWVQKSAFARLSFRTPQLHAAINKALKNGFPDQPLEI